MSFVGLHRLMKYLLVCLVGGTLILVFLKSIPVNVEKPDCEKTRVVIKCIEDPSDVMADGLESVQTIVPPNDRSNSPALCHDRIHPIKTENRHLSKVERTQNELCMKNYKEEIKKDWKQFQSNNQEPKHRNHHKYLTSESVVIEVGGNKGDDASAVIELYRPYMYIVLEPMKLVFRKLKERFIGTKNVMVYNFGLGALNGIFYVNIEGEEGEFTSLYRSSSVKGTCSLKIVNATSFFLLLGVGCYEVELLILNCGGCEFDVIESLLASNLINFFRHVHLVSHSSLESVPDSVERYCRIQQMLLRTHRPTYQFRFVTETWQRKDIILK